MRIRITQIDGKLPNVALMKLSHWHKAQGDEVVVTRSLGRDLFDGEFDRVYGSAIFTCFGTERLDRFQKAWPEAIVGGTGTFSTQTVEQIIGLDEYEHLDYEGWPDFEHSIGFTQRGCRLKCKFCVVPAKEGKTAASTPSRPCGAATRTLRISCCWTTTSSDKPNGASGCARFETATSASVSAKASTSG